MCFLTRWLKSRRFSTLIIISKFATFSGSSPIMFSLRRWFKKSQPSLILSRWPPGIHCAQTFFKLWRSFSSSSLLMLFKRIRNGSRLIAAIFLFLFGLRHAVQIFECSSFHARILLLFVLLMLPQQETLRITHKTKICCPLRQLEGSKNWTYIDWLSGNRVTIQEYHNCEHVPWLKKGKIA